MPWSFRIGKLFGIEVFVHVTFLLLLGFIGLSYWIQTHDPAAVITGVGFITALFACIVLHEFGHALTASRYGIRTRDITVLPIGGLARLERFPDKPVQELWVALAGPAVNIGIAAAILAYLFATSSLQPIGQIDTSGGSFLQRLALVNILLAIFNLLPAFPMDGGRILRALLATRMEFDKATGIAARTGQFMAILLGLLGLAWNPLLVLIALFVWVGAEQEYTMVKVRSTLAGVPLEQLMVTEFRTLHPNDTLGIAAGHLLSGFQQDFPIVEHDGELVGILTRADLVRALTGDGRMKPVGSVMRRDFQKAAPGESAVDVLPRLQNGDCETLPVVLDGRVVGLLTGVNVGAFLMTRDALDSGESTPAATRFRSARS